MKKSKIVKIIPIGVAAVIIVLAVLLVIFRNPVLGNFTDNNEISNATSGSGQEAPVDGDTTAPVITGVQEINVHLGTAIQYKSGVTVTDDTDPNPKLTVDSSNVNLSKIGRYRIYYIAEDASGNTCKVATYLNIAAIDAILLEDAEVYVDEVLSQIITDDMSDFRKIEEVYYYIHKLGYVDMHYADVEDYVTNGYYFLQQKRGDCRCVYASSKLLLERLGFKTQMITNKEGALVHYWNLVSMDDGETWYHFDPTGWTWADYEEPLMRTDAWMRAYSARHKTIPYNWDETEFVATPEKELEIDRTVGYISSGVSDSRPAEDEYFYNSGEDWYDPDYDDWDYYDPEEPETDETGDNGEYEEPGTDGAGDSGEYEDPGTDDPSYTDPDGGDDWGGQDTGDYDEPVDSGDSDGADYEEPADGEEGW